MRSAERRRRQDYAKPRLVLSRRRGEARGLHANEQSTRASFYRKESTSFWHARITTRFGGRTRPGDSIRILRSNGKMTVNMASASYSCRRSNSTASIRTRFITDSFQTHKGIATCEYSAAPAIAILAGADPAQFQRIAWHNQSPETGGNLRVPTTRIF